MLQNGFFDHIKEIFYMEPKYLKDKNSIKIWPYLDDISQHIIPYSDQHLSRTNNMIVNLDFSSVRRINSTGATITLSKLVSLLTGKNYSCKLVFSDAKENSLIKEFLQKTCFLNILDEKIQFEKADLFETVVINKFPESYVEFDEINKIKKTSLPIFHLKYNKKNDRENVELFSDWISDILIEKLSKFKIRLNVLLTLFNEIAKNSQDHTGNDAFWGIDIIENLNSKSGYLLFSCADMGRGIYRNVKDYIKQNTSHLRKDASEHLSYSDAYQFAFTIGNTTSRKPRNKGIGMSMIIDSACILNMDVTIWDARSMLLIPNNISHTELRKNAFDTDNKVGFYYYGRLNF